MKLHHIQKRVLCTSRNFLKCTLVCELQKAFNILYIYDYVTNLSGQHAEVVQNHKEVNIRNTGQGEAQHRKYMRLKLGSGQAYDRSSD
jgi:hypothetical protein